MAVPKIYYDGTKDEWVVVHNETDSGAICFGDCTGSSGNCTGSLPCGDTGVFGGGLNDMTGIEYITISTLGNAKNFGDLSVGRFGVAATSNGTNDRGVFGGGVDGDNKASSIIEYIIISTPNKIYNFGNLSIPRMWLAATSNGTYDRGVFGGGFKNGGRQSIIDYITISLPTNAQNFGNLISARDYLAATSNGINNRGVFGGGDNGNNLSTIDYIIISTPSNATDFGDLRVKRSQPAATSNGTNDRGVFGGGYNNISSIDYITISTPGNAHNFGNLTVGRRGLAATSNGTNDRGVFGGGYDSDNKALSIIEYITISTPSNASDFGDLTAGKFGLGATSNA